MPICGLGTTESVNFTVRKFENLNLKGFLLMFFIFSNVKLFILYWGITDELCCDNFR